MGYAIPLDEIYKELANQLDRDTVFVRDDLISRSLLVSLCEQFGNGGLILDCGCGDGYLSRICSSFAKEVVGIDVSIEMVNEAREGSKSINNVRVFHGDFLELPRLWEISNQSFTLCLCIFALCCLDRVDLLATAFKSMNSILQPEGVIIVQIPHPCEVFALTSSIWAVDRNSPESYFARGHLVMRDLKTTKKSDLVVGRYHYPLSDYFNTLAEAGFIIQHVNEPIPSENVLITYPDLVEESRRPSSIILVAQKASSRRP